MPRPSQQLDRRLLAAGAALYPALGCAGLTVRRVAEHAGVRPAMLSYHFGDKAGFLAALLQLRYEQLWQRLTRDDPADQRAVDRLRGALRRLAGFLREERAWVGRLLADALAGEAAVLAFLQRNAPRHLGLLTQLMAEAEAAGDLAPMAPLQRFTMTMGATAAPMLMLPAALHLGLLPPALAAQAGAQVLDEAAVDERIDVLLRALAPPPAPPPSRR